VNPSRRERAADLAVLVSSFPSLSQTFVLHELLDLERRGVRLHLFALSRAQDRIRHASLDRLRAVPEYLPDPLVSPCGSSVPRAHAALLARDPAGYVGAVRRIRSAPDYRAPQLDVTRALGRMSYVGRAGLLAQRLVELGSPPLHVHFAHHPVSVGRFAASLAGVRYGFFGHARDVWQTPREELAAKVRDAAVVFTCTAEAHAYLEQLAEGATPVRLAYHGAEVQPVIRRNPGNATPVVLAVGRLVKKKGFASLLRATALLQSRGLAFRVRIGGAGPEWPHLQRLAHELGIASMVAFLGPLDETEADAEYASADVFALPSRKLPDGDQDGLPNALVEAMAHGLPVVSTALPAIQEAVEDEISGFLVRPDDDVALAQALASLIRDSELRGRLGRRGRASVAARFDRTRTLAAVSAGLAEVGFLPAPARVALPRPDDTHVVRRRSDALTTT
jgi:glycosyltransferase involved in cell wall biosynthesis